MIVTAFYAGLYALMLVGLSVAVIRCRVRHKVALLDGGVAELSYHTRAHANFTEYAPMVLILIGTGEMLHSSHYLLHALGIAFLIGRISHFYSLTLREPRTKAQGRPDLKFRQLGMALTFTVLTVGALNALVVSLPVIL